MIDHIIGTATATGWEIQINGDRPFELGMQGQRHLAWWLIYKVCGHKLANRFSEDFYRVVVSEFDPRGFNIHTSMIWTLVDALKCPGK